MAVSLVTSETRVRVSSVLNRDTKQFGKKFLFDGEEDTCWNSDQGSPQWIHVQFDQVVEMKEVHMRFQGGFAGKECWMEVSADGDDVKKVEFFPEDSNSLQISFGTLY